MVAEAAGVEATAAAVIVAVVEATRRRRSVSSISQSHMMAKKTGAKSNNVLGLTSSTQMKLLSSSG